MNLKELHDDLGLRYDQESQIGIGPYEIFVGSLDYEKAMSDEDKDLLQSRGWSMDTISSRKSPPPPF